MSVLGEPGGKGSRAYGDAKTLLDALCGLRDGMAMVVEGEGFEDDFERVRLALGELWSENRVAVFAVPELDGFVLFVALPFFGDGSASTVDAAFEIGADELCSTGARCGGAC